MRQSAWYYVEMRSCTLPLITSSIEERRRVRRGSNAILRRVVCRATRYSYPLLAPVNIAPFTSSSRAATPATHAITRLACPPEVKSWPRGKFTHAREYVFHCSPLSSHFPSAILYSLYFSKVNNICASSYLERMAYIKIYLSKRFLLPQNVCNSLLLEFYISE